MKLKIKIFNSLKSEYIFSHMQYGDEYASVLS